MNAPVQTSTRAILSQVNNHIPSALSDLRHIRQDIREDIAELPEVFHGLSSASFERLIGNRRNLPRVRKPFSK